MGELKIDESWKKDNLRPGVVMQYSNSRNLLRMQRVVFESEDHGAVRCEISYANYRVYRFYSSDMWEAVVKATTIIPKLEKFPVPIWNRSDCECLLGRKVWYREMAAVIQDFDGERGTVTLRPDNAEKVFVPEPWTGAHDHVIHETLWNQSIKEDLLSPQIYWFRETEG